MGKQTVTKQGDGCIGGHAPSLGCGWSCGGRWSRIVLRQPISSKLLALGRLACLLACMRQQGRQAARTSAGGSLLKGVPNSGKSEWLGALCMDLAKQYGTFSSPLCAGVCTGVPNSGKSEWLDALCMNLAKQHGWAFAMASFEKSPKGHARNLLEKYAEKPFMKCLRKSRCCELECWVLCQSNWAGNQFNALQTRRMYSISFLDACQTQDQVDGDADWRGALYQFKRTGTQSMGCNSRPSGRTCSILLLAACYAQGRVDIDAPVMRRIRDQVDLDADGREVPQEQMSEEELRAGMEFLDSHFLLIRLNTCDQLLCLQASCIGYAKLVAGSTDRGCSRFEDSTGVEGAAELQMVQAEDVADLKIETIQVPLLGYFGIPQLLPASLVHSPRISLPVLQA
eukprot:570842-Pelagomonas_calceolata.AAC.2